MRRGVRRLLAVVAAAVVAGCAEEVLQIIADDPYEPNDTIAEARDNPDALLAEGYTISDGVVTSGDRYDFFRIEVPAGAASLTVVCAFANALGNIDLFLWRDGDASPLYYSTGTGDGETLSGVAVSPGTYYIEVRLVPVTGLKVTTYGLSWVSGP